MSDDNKLTIEEFHDKVHALAQSLANRMRIQYITKNHDREFFIVPAGIGPYPYPYSIKLDHNGQVSYGKINCEVIQCDNCL